MRQEIAENPNQFLDLCLFIKGSVITNSNYQITAGENVIMNATNINNISTANTATQAALNPTKIEAGSIVSLNATKDSNGNGGNINNIGATIKGGDLVYLTAENNVIVQQNLVSHPNIFPSLLPKPLAEQLVNLS
jgi:hypothetical protein